MTREAAVLALFGLIGCRSEARESSADASKPAAVAEWWCGAVREAKPVERKNFGAPGQALRVGLVADTKEALAPTLANVTHFAAAFQKEKVTAVIALGGLGANEDEIFRVLSSLRAAGAPILALPGDREPEGAFHAAIARAKKSGLDVIDLADARAVAGDGLQIFSLPGYRFPSYLGARDTACRYRPADVDALTELATALDGRATNVPRLLVAHTPPRGAGPAAIDWALGGANIGDVELARVLPKLGATAGAFAHVDEAGGRASDGRAPVAENSWSDRLYVNAGAADSVPHDLDSGATGRGQAMIVEFADGKARFRIVR